MTRTISNTSSVNCTNMTCTDLICTTGSFTSEFYPPVLTTAARTALSVTEGAIVYDSDLDGLYVYDGSAWQSVTPTPAPSFDPNSLLIQLTTLTNFTTSSTDFSTGWTCNFQYIRYHFFRRSNNTQTLLALIEFT